jgi:DNA polymerase III subunit delta'
MKWDDLLGHKQQYDWFQTALSNGRLATSFLFVGPEGIGKRTFARLLAKSLLCRKTPPSELSFCGECEDCVQVEASTHPDLIQVAKPPDKAFLPVELLIGEREKRMREGLCHDISLRPYSGRHKVAILDDADTLNAEGANCLLKTLEEPPGHSLLLLIGTSLQRQLPTIRSRCQAILFNPLSSAEITQLLCRGLLSNGEEEYRQVSEADALALSEQSQGSLTKAQLLMDEELQQFRKQLESMLSSRQVPLTGLAKDFGALVDAAGKENRLKRDRMKILLEMSAAFYRNACLRLASSNEAAAQRRVPQLLRCWNRCLTAIEQVDRNANQAALLEAWSADMASYSGQ